MLTKPTHQQLLPRKLFGICMMAGIAFFVMIPSAFAFQSVTPQSPKNAAISNMKRQINAVRDTFVEIRSQAEENLSLISELTSKRKKIYEKQDSLGISKESFGDVLKNLQAQRIGLMIDLAGMDARRDSLTLIQQKSEAGANADPTALELLKKLVQLRSKKLDEAKQRNAQGVTGPTEVSEAQVEFVNAQLKLALAKSSNQVSPRVNDELLSVSLDRAEKTARLVKIEELLKTIIESRKSLLENEDVSAKIGAAQRKQEALDTESAAMEKRLKSLEMRLQRMRQEED